MTVPIPALPPSTELARRLARSPLLLALDIDGTLAAIAPTPEAAFVPDDTRRTLASLADKPGVRVAFVTGRAAQDGRRLAGVSHTWTIGNHGVERIDPAGELHVNEEAASFANQIDEAITLLARDVGAIPGVFLENKRWTLSVHYRRADRGDVPGVKAAVQAVAARLALRVMHGKEIVELHPPVTINKGIAIVELASITGAFDGGLLRGSVLYAGDDRTDEDAFRVLRERSRESVTIHVGHLEPLGKGSSATAAEFSVPDPSGLRELLEWVLRVR